MSIRKYFCLFTTCVILAVSLTSCTVRKSIENIGESGDFSSYGDIVFGASVFGHKYSVCESGIFSLKNNHMQYYDFDQKKSYILCSKPNCTHNSEECSSWYEAESDVLGFAYHNDKMYAFFYNEEKNSYELTEMNLTGEERRVIASIDMGTYKSGEWVINHITDRVHYAGEMVWVTLNKQYIEDTEKNIMFETQAQCVGIHLDTGEISYLNEVNFDTQNTKYGIKGITTDKVLIIKEKAAEKMLTEEKFYQAYQSGMISGQIFEEAEDAYDAYSKVWFPHATKWNEEYLYYDVNTKEMISLEKMEKKEMIEGTEVVGYWNAFIFNGWYEGKLLCNTAADIGESSTVFLWDLESNEKENLFEIKNGGCLLVKSDNDIMESICNKSQVLYCEYVDETTAQIFKYDLGTGETIPLFLDSRQISFRMEDETSDRYIGKVEEGRTYCWIWKEDYENGDLDKIHQIGI